MRDTFNVPYDLFPPLLIKLLITFGCYGHRGDIPQVLSAAWAQKNPRRGTSLPPTLIPSLLVAPLVAPTSLLRWKTKAFLQSACKSRLRVSKVQDPNGSFQCSPPRHPHLHHSPSVGPPLWLHCRGFCSLSSCLEMRTRHGPLRAFTRYCYVSEPIN